MKKNEIKARIDTREGEEEEGEEGEEEENRVVFGVCSGSHNDFSNR